MFKNYSPFTDCIREINNTQIVNAKDIDVVMNMHNLIEFSENYSQTSERFWLYYTDQPALDNNDIIILLTFLLMMISVFRLHIKKCNWQGRKWWHKKYWNIGTTKISK